MDDHGIVYRRSSIVEILMGDFGPDVLAAPVQVVLWALEVSASPIPMDGKRKCG